MCWKKNIACVSLILSCPLFASASQGLAAAAQQVANKPQIVYEEKNEPKEGGIIMRNCTLTDEEMGHVIAYEIIRLKPGYMAKVECKVNVVESYFAPSSGESVANQVARKIGLFRSFQIAARGEDDPTKYTMAGQEGEAKKYLPGHIRYTEDAERHRAYLAEIEK